MSIDQQEMRVLEYLEGEMSPDEEAAFLREVENDPALAAVLADYQEQEQLLHVYYDQKAETLLESRRPDLSGAAVVMAKPRRSPAVWIWSAAAALALVVGGGSYLMGPAAPTGTGVEAVVAVEGRAQAFASANNNPQALQAGGELTAVPDVERLKTPAGSQMEVALAGRAGTLEMRENSTVRVRELDHSVALTLERGEVLLNTEAAPSPAGAVAAAPPRPVRVQTPYFDAEGTGAIFNVTRGLRGAEVAVLSGEVEIRQNGSRKRLRGGESFSSTGVQPVALSQRIAWSRHAEELAALLPQQDPGSPAASGTAAASTADDSGPQAFTTGGSVSLSGPSVFLPADTVGLVEIRDMQEMLRESGAASLGDAVLSAALREAWSKGLAGTKLESDQKAHLSEHFDKIVSNEALNAILGSMGGAVSIGIAPRGLVLVSEAMARHGDLARELPAIQQAAAEANERGEDAVNAQLVNGFLVIGITGPVMEEVAEAARTVRRTEFASGDFFRKVRTIAPASYFTAALDAQSFMARATQSNPGSERALRMMGLANMETMVAATGFADQADNQGLRVTFDGPREGVISWLDTPGPLSSFQFFSPDTHVLMAARIKRPEEMLRNVLGWMEARNRRMVPDSEPEFQLMTNLIATLGNEAAIGLDNPVLPIPNVKAAIEVLDPMGFHSYMVELMELMWSDVDNPHFTVEVKTADYRDHLVVSFSYPGSDIGLSYAIVDDFVVLGPGSMYLRSSIDAFLDGGSLANEYAFQQALPAKSGTHASGLIYVAANESLNSSAPMLQEVLGNYNIPVHLESLITAPERTQAAVYYAIADDDQIDLYIEGIKGSYQMGGLLPAVANWIEGNRPE